MALSDVELEALLLSGEADRIERKRNASDMDRIREAVCAFANDLPGYRQPGVAFIGIEDDGTCSGLAIDDNLLLRLSQVRDGDITPVPVIEIRRVTLRGCDIAVVIVQPSENPPVRLHGVTWIRVGPRRARATPEEERRLVERRRWGNLPFDAQPVAGATLDDLDLQRFALEYLPLLVDQQTIAQNQRTTQQQLRALRLIGVDEVPTTTALLMLGKSTQDWLPGAVISWRRIGGTQLTDQTLDERTLTGTVADQLRLIDEVMSAAIATRLTMGAGVHSRTADYPLSALQQLVRNAVMHRTYDGSHAPVRVTWYADRVEVLSPGGLYGTVTPQNFGQPGITDYRNPTLAEALKAYGYVERFGQGLEIVRQSLAANGNPPVEFQLQPPDAPTWVHAVVRKAP